MERIDPAIQYITTPLPHPSTHKALWKRYKNPLENLFLTKIPKEKFLFSSDDTIIESITGYYTVGRYFDESQTTREPTYRWQHDFEMYLKLVWLTEMYLSNNMKYPMGAHWNPRSNFVIVHPGGSRNVIYRLFHSGSIEVIFFNTNGVNFDWTTKDAIVTVEDLEKKYNQQIEFVVTSDHGTLIPHLHFDPRSIDQNIVNYHKSINELLNNEIYVNYSFDEKFSKIPVSNNSEAKIRIYFKTSPTLEDQFRAIILFPIRKSRIEFGNILIEKDI